MKTTSLLTGKSAVNAAVSDDGTVCLVSRHLGSRHVWRVTAKEASPVESLLAAGAQMPILVPGDILIIALKLGIEVPLRTVQNWCKAQKIIEALADNWNINKDAWAYP